MVQFSFGRDADAGGITAKVVFVVCTTFLTGLDFS